MTEDPGNVASYTSMLTQSTTLTCKYCAETFQRNGHLQRHLLRHTNSKPFTCKTCSKSFSRSDTLQRHRLTHARLESSQSDQKRASRACASCVKTKQRCYGGKPCIRCERKGLCCDYVGDQRQSSVSPVYPTSDPLPTHGSSQTINDHEVIIAQPAFMPVSQSATDSLELTSQASDAALPSCSSVSISMSDRLSGEVKDTDRSSLLHFPCCTNSEEPGLFADFSSHGLSYFDETSSNFNLPFAWMMRTHENSSQAPHPFGSDISNSSMPNYSSLITLGHTDSPELIRSGIRSHAATEVRKRGFGKGVGVANSHPVYLCPSFPIFEKDASQSAGAEVFGHVSRIPAKAYTDVRTFYISERGYDDMSFPQSRLLHVFVELYFEYFDPYMPFLHPVRVERDDLSWILLIAVAAIGSQYSEVRDAPAFTTVFHHLLQKAIQAHPVTQRTDISFVQSVLLRDIGLFSSGLPGDRAILQRQRSMITNLCCCLSTHTGASDNEEYTVNHTLDRGWLSWLQGEEVVRLMHCVYTLECLQLILFDQRPLFRLTDFTQRLPCDDAIWRSRTEISWNEQKHLVVLGSQALRFDLFSKNIRIVSLYANERAILDQMQSTQRLSFLLRPEIGIDLQERAFNSNRDSLLSSGASLDDITYLDHAIDDAISSKHLPHHVGEQDMHDPLVHVISILRDIPLRMIYASVGWEANVAEMQQTRERLKGYLRRNPSTARICLWHAARIHSSVRNYRYPACYAFLSFAIAVSYILLYDQILERTDTQGDVIRLDKLKEKTNVDVWARDGEGSKVHITGIGILNSTESSRRLLVDAGNILQSQKPWRNISEPLANCFAQMSQNRSPRAN